MDDYKDYEYTAYNKKLLENAKELRKHMTLQERHLWYDFLRKYHMKFYKQRPIATYIADFYCPEAKLVIEIDGSQHYSDEGLINDENRTYVLNMFDLEVIRFSNHDVNTNFEGVCIAINEKIKERIEILEQRKDEGK
ncbi:MAG: endonuclease domain-containing protein [Clostridia bacterium]|nr:endonuclease domain-containing protein [Clostridia bacterium]